MPSGRVVGGSRAACGAQWKGGGRGEQGSVWCPVSVLLLGLLSVDQAGLPALPQGCLLSPCLEAPGLLRR